MLETVLLTIVIGKLVSWLNVLYCHHENPAILDLRLAVRCAGVVDVARLIDLRLPIDGLVLRDFKEVLTLAGLALFLRDDAADVLDHTGPFRYGFSRKETETGTRALYVELPLAGHILPSGRHIVSLYYDLSGFPRKT